MGIILATTDGVWELNDGQNRQLGLSGKYVSHVATHEGTVLATVPFDGAYVINDDGEALVWEGDARACAIGTNNTYYVGTEPAMIYRSHDSGKTWLRSDKIDELPTRSDWEFPLVPHQPHVRSIDFIPGEPDSILVGIEVGGVLLSKDKGENWEELNDAVDLGDSRWRFIDVHTVRPDPIQSGRLLAVTGNGFYGSDNGGRTWERRMEGISLGYTVGLHVNPDVAGELLVNAGRTPPGINGLVYYSRDAGHSWELLTDNVLPDQYARVPVVFFADNSSWIATNEGQVFRAGQVQGPWSLVGELPAAINAATSSSGPSSTVSGSKSPAAINAATSSSGPSSTVSG